MTEINNTKKGTESDPALLVDMMSQERVENLPTFLIVSKMVSFLKSFRYIRQVFKDSVYAWDNEGNKNTKVLPCIAIYLKRQSQPIKQGWTTGYIQLDIIFPPNNNRAGITKQLLIATDRIKYYIQNCYEQYRLTYIDTGKSDWFIGWGENINILNDMTQSRDSISMEVNFRYDMYEYLNWVQGVINPFRDDVILLPPVEEFGSDVTWT